MLTTFANLQVDRDSRCAVVLLYDRHLAVIPFISDSQSSEEGAIAAASKPASSYLIDLQKLGILNVKDFQFINGYYEPTLMFLFEPDHTWAGRYVKKKNTASAAIVSLHVLIKSHTTIWKLDKLPHDCHTIAPLPPPTGGALILGFNEVHFLNQSSSRYRLSLNHFGDEAQSLDGETHTKEKTRVAACLEASRFTFLDDDTLLVSTHSGDLFALTVVSDGRTVTHIDMQKAGSATLASTMTTVNHELLFLGSRVGDSYLIRFSVKSQTKVTGDGIAAPQTDQLKEFIDPQDLDDDVADIVGLMLHSKKARLLNQERSHFPKWAMQVCDVLPSLAAVSSVALERAVEGAEDSLAQGTQSPQLEMVCACGRGKGGSLAVVQQSVRPSVLTSLELPGCQAVWSVFRHGGLGSSMEEEDGKFQKYVILSRANSTMVLQTGESISEVTNDAEFRVDAPTLNVANMFGKSRFVQVHEGGFYLVDGLTPTQIESLPDGIRVVWSSVCDPYLMTLLSDDSIQLFVASPETSKLKPLQISLDVASDPIAACCLFQDTSSVLPFNRKRRSTEANAAEEAVQARTEDIMDVDNEEDLLMHQDPEEVLLYGLSSKKSKKRSREELENGSAVDETTHTFTDNNYVLPEHIERPYYAAIARSSGSLEIYELPDFKLVWYLSKGLCDGSSLLTSEVAANPAPSVSKQSKTPVEISFCSLGSTHLSATMIVLYDTGEIALFRSFALASSHQQMIPLALTRIHSDVLTHNLRKPGGGIAEAIAMAAAAAAKAERKAAAAAASANGFEEAAEDAEALADSDEESSDEGDGAEVDTRVISSQRTRWSHHRVVPFENIQGKPGVFIAGVRPVWLMCERDYVRAFLMDLDGPVQAFTPFNNVNCVDGFIYYAPSASKLKISQQKPGWSFELPLPVLRVPIRATPHSVAYDPENEVCSLQWLTRPPSNFLRFRRWLSCSATRSRTIFDTLNLLQMTSAIRTETRSCARRDWTRLPPSTVRPTVRPGC